MIGGCLLAVGILIKDLWFSEITPMNLYLSLYFVVVNLLYFALSVQWVFNFRHVLSYLALGIFAWGSVYIDKPYTIYEARKSYSKSFESSTLFLEVNLLITKIWGSVYFISALIRLLSEDVLAVVVIQCLIAIGIILSISIPNYMPET